MHIFKKYKSDSNLYAFQRIQILECEEYKSEKCMFVMIFPAVVNTIIQIVNTKTERKNKILFSLRFETVRYDTVIPPESQRTYRTVTSIQKWEDIV